MTERHSALTIFEYSMSPVVIRPAAYAFNFQTTGPRVDSLYFLDGSMGQPGPANTEVVNVGIVKPMGFGDDSFTRLHE